MENENSQIIVPQAIADYIEEHKARGWSVSVAIEEASEEGGDETIEWLALWGKEALEDAWNNGYELAENDDECFC